MNSVKLGLIFAANSNHRACYVTWITDSVLAMKLSPSKTWEDYYAGKLVDIHIYLPEAGDEGTGTTQVTNIIT